MVAVFCAVQMLLQNQRLRPIGAQLQGPLNFPFREPLATPESPAPASELRHVPGYRSLPPEAISELGERLSGRRVLVVAGGRQRPGFAAAASQ